MDDATRIAAVRALNLLDTEPELPFEDAVQLASVICGTPISLITVLDGRRQWFKSRVGLSFTEAPQQHAFCAHAIIQSDLFIVEDALQDDRFKENPLVTGRPDIRFYAGMPLRTPDGYSLGTLCVIDTVPRALTAEQQASLKLLSRQVENQIAMRNQIKRLSEALVETSHFHEQVVDSNALFQAFMDHSPLVGYMKDAQGRMLYYNRPFAERFSITRDEWIGKDDFAIWPDDFATRFRAVDLAVLEKGEVSITEDISPGPDNRFLHWRTYKFPFDNSDGVRLLAGLSLDISVEKNAELALRVSHEQLERANQKLQELTVTDSLTGLCNRRGFDEELEKAFRGTLHYPFGLALLLIDVDEFKKFNDSFGHSEGDAVLRIVARLLKEGSRSADTVCRYGGEEFALLLPGTDLNAAFLLGERLCELIATAGWEHRAVTVSIGVAVSCDSVVDTAELIRRADLALYEAKARGRNCTIPFLGDYS